MATQPVPSPDIIEPNGPEERPIEAPPSEAPHHEPDEIIPPQPDIVEPGGDEA